LHSSNSYIHVASMSIVVVLKIGWSKLQCIFWFLMATDVLGV